jgi:hypothetical protein
MAKKIYQKRGNLNFKERKLIEQIEAKLSLSPDLDGTYETANSFDELRELHIQLTSSDTEFTEVPKDDLPKESSSIDKKSNPFIDPLNREEPNVRDYVMDDKFDPFADFQSNTKSAYAEPTNYDQAFDIPDEEEMRNQRQNPQGAKQQQNAPRQQKQESRQQSSGDGDSAKDKRKSKRFAKTIVNTICNLLEVGFVWYATKDINEQKLTEYEMSGEMDLSVLVELSTGEEATIKEFFLNQLGDIEKASKVAPERREDIIEALTEYFIEKGIQPSAQYDLILEGVSLLAEKGIQLYVITSQNKSILNQLRERNTILQGERPKPEYREPTPPPQRNTSENVSTQVSPDYIEQLELARASKSSAQTSNEVSPINESIELDMEEEMENDLSLLRSIETKE